MTIKQIHENLKAKKISAKEITQGYLKTIREKDSDIGAFLRVDEEGALKQAQVVDELIASGAELASLAGVPVALKDNMLITGRPATAASKMLENYVASYDAGVVKKLKAQNAVLIGQTNMDEFAMGSSTENSAYQKTKNPHDLTRVPGGSSGGSAAAVAADMVPVALGSDTGGSIRQPAHMCGVVGLKPTYGAVSRSGLVAMASSLDQIGPFTKTVEDCAIAFNAIAGKDPYDNTSVAPTKTDGTRTDTDKWRHELLNPDFNKLKGMTIGIPSEYFVDGLEPEVRSAIEGVIKDYEKAGIKTKKISLPHTKYALSAYYIIMPAEVSSNLARLDGIRYANVTGVERSQHNLKSLYLEEKSRGYGPETKRRVILGTFVLSSGYYDAFYKKALDVKEYITDDFTNAFKEVDVILSPVAPTRAFKIGEKSDNPLEMYLSDILTIPADLAGIPAISIPVKGIKGLPIGFHLQGKHWREADILGMGRLYESL